MAIILIRRFIGFVIDVLLIYGFSYICLVLLKIKIDNINIMLFAGFYSLVYFVIFWLKFYGKTPGSSLMGFKVVKSTDLKTLDFKSALFRVCILLTIICPIGIIKILGALNIVETIYFLRRSPYKEKQQTAWDIAAKSLVVKI